MIKRLQIFPICGENYVSGVEMNILKNILAMILGVFLLIIMSSCNPRAHNKTKEVVLSNEGTQDVGGFICQAGTSSKQQCSMEGAAKAQLLRTCNSDVKYTDGNCKAVICLKTHFLTWGNCNPRSDASWITHSGQFVEGQAQYADVNGDGRTDLIFQNGDNEFYVSLAKSTNGFEPPYLWIEHEGTFVKGQAKYADINGDGKSDLIFQGNDNIFLLSLSTGSVFSKASEWVKHEGSFLEGQAEYVDINGDGKSDLMFQTTDNQFLASISNDTGHATPKKILKHGGNFIKGMAQYTDLNGDGKSDLIFQGTDNRFWISLSNTDGLGNPELFFQHEGSFSEGHAQYADVNGDGKSDLIFQKNDNSFWVSSYTKEGPTSPIKWMQHGGNFNTVSAQYADFDGDGNSDLVLQSHDNKFYVSLAKEGGFATPETWYTYKSNLIKGQAKYADINGDGKSDLIFQSTSNVFGESLSTGSSFSSPTSWSKFAKSLVNKTTEYFPAAVVIIPSPASELNDGLVIIPEKTLLDTNGSTTSGFAEAVKYAFDEGWDIFVYGKGQFSETGNYHFAGPLSIPEFQGKTIHMYNVNLIFGPQVTESALEFDSTMIGDIQIYGTINASYAEYGVHFNPRNYHPLDGCLYGTLAITDSRFYIGSIIAKDWPIYFNNETVGIPWNQFNFPSVTSLSGKYPAILNYESMTSPTTLNFVNNKYRSTPNHNIFNPNAVVLIPPEGDLSLGHVQGRIFLPNGDELKITSTTTSGIQEAINKGLSGSPN